jgi:hypothetical protein
MGFVASFNLLNPCLAYLILDMRGVMAKNEVDDLYIYIYIEREREREKGYHLFGDQVKELVLMKLLLNNVKNYGLSVGDICQDGWIVVATSYTQMIFV